MASSHSESEGDKKARSAPPGGESFVVMEPFIIIDAGRRSWGDVREFKEGHGALLQEAVESLRQLRQNGEINANAQPILFIVTT